MNIDILYFESCPNYETTMEMVRSALDALGAQATMMLFGVRFAAIVVEIIMLLLVSNFLIRPWAEKAAARGAGTAVPDIATPASNPSKQKKFWPQVWSRSRRTLRPAGRGWLTIM